jgi:hypothetical protein
LSWPGRTTACAHRPMWGPRY